jgi:predicted TIM-barrel fold metal-dependent hydrolase
MVHQRDEQHALQVILGHSGVIDRSLQLVSQEDWGEVMTHHLNEPVKVFTRAVDMCEKRLLCFRVSLLLPRAHVWAVLRVDPVRYHNGN